MVKAVVQVDQSEHDLNIEQQLRRIRPVKLEVDPYLPSQDLIASVRIQGQDQSNPIVLDDEPEVQIIALEEDSQVEELNAQERKQVPKARRQDPIDQAVYHQWTRRIVARHNSYKRRMIHRSFI